MKTVEIDFKAEREKGRSLKEIAEDCDLSISTVRNRILAAGGQVRQGANIEFDFKAEYEKGRSLESIAKDLSISVPTVKKRLLEAGGVIQNPKAFKSVEFDFRGEYESGRSLESIVEMLAQSGVEMSRNTVRSRIKAAGGVINNQGTRAKTLTTTKVKISKYQFKKLARLGDAVGLSVSEVARTAIALWLEAGEPLDTDRKPQKHPISFGVWVTPDTLARLESGDRPKAESIRAALDFVNLYRLKTCQASEPV